MLARVNSNLPTYLPTSYPPPASYLLPVLELGLLRAPCFGLRIVFVAQGSLPDLLQTQESLHTASPRPSKPGIATYGLYQTSRTPWGAFGAPPVGPGA